MNQATLNAFVNIRKLYVFLMFSGGRERVNWNKLVNQYLKLNS